MAQNRGDRMAKMRMSGRVNLTWAPFHWSHYDAFLCSSVLSTDYCRRRGTSGREAKVQEGPVAQHSCAPAAIPVPAVRFLSLFWTLNAGSTLSPRNKSFHTQSAACSVFCFETVAKGPVGGASVAAHHRMQGQGEGELSGKLVFNPSFPRVIDFKFPLQPHQK